MKLKKYISAILFACMLLCAFSLIAFAQGPDQSVKGSLTVEMKSGDNIVKGGTLTAYRVGEIREDNSNYSFVKTDIMEAFTGAYTNIESPTLAEEVYSFVTKQKITAYATAENKNGKVVFSDLELGLYLIVQTKKSNGYEPLKSFLVSIPMNEDGQYVYDVNAKGKFLLTKDVVTTNESAKPTETPKPTDPTLPRTGQLKWPIPVLATVGLCLFAVGWALRFTRKRSDDEE